MSKWQEELLKRPMTGYPHECYEGDNRRVIISEEDLMRLPPSARFVCGICKKPVWVKKSEFVTVIE